jgi:hypothetical protein
MKVLRCVSCQSLEPTVVEIDGVALPETSQEHLEALIKRAHAFTEKAALAIIARYDLYVLEEEGDAG